MACSAHKSRSLGLPWRTASTIDFRTSQASSATDASKANCCTFRVTGAPTRFNSSEASMRPKTLRAWMAPAMEGCSSALATSGSSVAQILESRSLAISTAASLCRLMASASPTSGAPGGAASAALAAAVLGAASPWLLVRTGEVIRLPVAMAAPFTPPALLMLAATIGPLSVVLPPLPLLTAPAPAATPLPVPPAKGAVPPGPSLLFPARPTADHAASTNSAFSRKAVGSPPHRRRTSLSSRTVRRPRCSLLCGSAAPEKAPPLAARFPRYPPPALRLGCATAAPRRLEGLCDGMRGSLRSRGGSSRGRMATTPAPPVCSCPSP